MKTGKNQQVVLHFFDALSERDRDRVYSFLADDSRFKTPEGSVAVGQEAIWQALNQAHSEALDWRLDTLDEDSEGQVLAKFSGRMLQGGEWQDFQSRGRFAVKGSKIIQWG